MRRPPWCLGFYGTSSATLTHFIPVLSLFQWFSVFGSQDGKTQLKNLAATSKFECFTKITNFTKITSFKPLTFSQNAPSWMLTRFLSVSDHFCRRMIVASKRNKKIDKINKQGHHNCTKNEVFH